MSVSAGPRRGERAVRPIRAKERDHCLNGEVCYRRHRCVVGQNTYHLEEHLYSLSNTFSTGLLKGALCLKSHENCVLLLQFHIYLTETGCRGKKGFEDPKC